MVCYKETLSNAKIDPSPEWTGTWRDPRFSPPSNGGRPENELTGTLFKAINPSRSRDFAIEVPAQYDKLRLWRDTSVAELQPGRNGRADECHTRVRVEHRWGPPESPRRSHSAVRDHTDR